MQAVSGGIKTNVRGDRRFQAFAHFRVGGLRHKTTAEEEVVKIFVHEARQRSVGVAETRGRRVAFPLRSFPPFASWHDQWHE